MSESIIYPFAFNGITVRAFKYEGNVWFVANDVGKALGMSNIRRLISLCLADDERMHVQKKYSEEARAWVVTNCCDLTGGRTKLVTINESGLCTIVMRSTKPRAVEFRHWVTSEVLPSILKTGSYTIPQLNVPALPSEEVHELPAEGPAIEIRRGKPKKVISLTTPKMTLEVPANSEGYEFIHDILRDYL